MVVAVGSIGKCHDPIDDGSADTDNEAIDGASPAGTAMKWLGGAWSLLKIGGVTLGAGLAVALCWAWYHRGDVVLLPFEGTDGASMSLRLGRALEDVALGSTTDIGLAPSMQLASDDGPPPVNIPGTGVSFASLVGFVQLGPLAETRVHGVLVDQDKAYQVSLQVFGPAGEKAIHTDAMRDSDEALIQAAEDLYRLLNPIALASYLFRRDPNQSREVIGDILSDPRRSPEDEAAAYRIWGLVLADEQDFDGAREKFEAAIKSPVRHGERFQARVWVDIGQTYLWEQRWTDAAKAFEQSAASDHTWEVPHNLLGDALQGSGDVPGAMRQYQEATRLNPGYVEPWNGLARTYAGQEQYGQAFDAYTRARHLQLLRNQAAAFTYYGLGDVLFKVGCDAAATEQYDRAVGIDPSFEDARYDWGQSLACQLPSLSAGPAIYPWRPGPPPEARDDTLCASPNQREPTSIRE